MAKTVGKSLKRIDGYSKVTGKAQYPNDLEFPNMLYAGVLRSTIPHGRILKLHTKEAEGLEGVVCIIDHTMIPGEKYNGVMLKDMPFLVVDVVKRVGDPIALVVAENKKILKEALSLIRVEYEEFKGIFTIEDALKEEAPEIQVGIGRGKNLNYDINIIKGNIKKGFKEAEYVVENTYTTQHIEHSFLQPEAGIGRVDDEGNIQVYVATQYPHYDREEVAKCLGIEKAKVKIINTAVGGAFGAREDITLQAHCALAAFYTKRPVKIVYSREESTLAHCKRHAVKIHYKSGIDKKGKLTAVQVRIFADTGAYSSWGPSVTRKCAVHATGPYEIPNVEIKAYSVYTNNGFCGAMRGFGALQASVAYESQMDILASKIGMNPLKFRYINAFKPGSKTSTGQDLKEHVALKECIKKIAEIDNVKL